MSSLLAMRAASIPIHPYLFALMPPLTIYVDNPGFFDPAELIRPFILIFLAVLVVHCAASLATKSVHRGALIASLVVALLLVAAFFFNAPELKIPKYVPYVVLPITVFLAVRHAFGIRQLGRSDVRRFNIIANAFMLAAYLVPIEKSVFSNPLNTAHAEAVLAERGGALSLDFDSRSLPDIYHIVLDGYSRADVLLSIYGLENAAFEDELRDLGFFVATNGVANYNRTISSLSSLFSLDYLSQEAEWYRVDQGLKAGEAIDAKHLRRYLVRIGSRRELFAALRDGGYTLYATEFVYQSVLPPHIQIAAPANHSICDFNTYETAVYKFLGLGRLCRLVTGSSGNWEELRRRTSYALTQRVYDGLESPFWFYQHILPPHPPFLFEPDGSDVPEHDILDIDDSAPSFADRSKRQRIYRNGYVGQVRYLNNVVLAQIRDFMAGRRRPFIILLHGDHGGRLSYDRDDARTVCHYETFSPLIAVYSNDSRLQRAMQNDISLVNLYRPVLNMYFGADLPLRATRSFYETFTGAAKSVEVAQHRFREQCEAFEVEPNRTAKTSIDTILTHRNTANS